MSDEENAKLLYRTEIGEFRTPSSRYIAVRLWVRNEGPIEEHAEPNLVLALTPDQAILLGPSLDGLGREFSGLQSAS